MSQPEAFTVKELAPLMGVSVRYVYEMRRLGFKMRGPTYCNRACSMQDAVDWIRSNGFRMVNGRGRLQTLARAS